MFLNLPNIMMVITIPRLIVKYPLFSIHDQPQAPACQLKNSLHSHCTTIGTGIGTSGEYACHRIAQDDLTPSKERSFPTTNSANGVAAISQISNSPHGNTGFQGNHTPGSAGTNAKSGQIYGGLGIQPLDQC